MASTVLLHIVGQHPGGVAVDYASVAVVGVCLSVAFAYFVKAQPAPRTGSAGARRRPARSMAAVPRSSTPSRSRANVALSLLGLSVLIVQGFHVIEHVVVVVQVEALGRPLAQSQGLLGARVDFEWLHLAYNTTFLATMVLLLGYGLRHRAGALAGAGLATAALAGGVAMQSYHVGEHILRIIQYLNTGCTPCVGLIGQVVLFIWPHLFFGVFAYTAFTIAYFAYGLHRELLPQPAAHDPTDGSGPTEQVVEASPPSIETRARGIDAPAHADATVLGRASRFHVPALEPPALPAFVITRRSNHHA